MKDKEQIIADMWELGFTAEYHDHGALVVIDVATNPGAAHYLSAHIAQSLEDYAEIYGCHWSWLNPGVIGLVEG